MLSDEVELTTMDSYNENNEKIQGIKRSQPAVPLETSVQMVAEGPEKC